MRQYHLTGHKTMTRSAYLRLPQMPKTHSKKRIKYGKRCWAFQSNDTNDKCTGAIFTEHLLMALYLFLPYSLSSNETQIAG